MQFFIDSASKDEVLNALQTGLIDGITTNPSLVAKTGESYQSIVENLLEMCSGPISVEVLSVDAPSMWKEAQHWARLADNIVIKLPLTPDGIKVTQQCTHAGIKTNVTLCFSATQALLAAKAGATYISPFIGRLDDISHLGMDLVREIKQIYSHYQFETKILAASIRSPLHVKEAALVGADVCTIPLKTLSSLFVHPLTASGLQTFIEDSKKIP